MNRILILLWMGLLSVVPATVTAQNPIIQTKYTADPFKGGAAGNLLNWDYWEFN